MKSIIISIKPEWVAKILNGEKTIEIRKTAPKCDLPIELYIYCTKSKDFLLDRDQNFFVWDKHEHHYLYEYEEEPKKHYFQGKIVAKFTLREVEIFDDFDEELCNRACLDRGQILDYLGTKLGYAWHISDLEIFDEPKELDEFGLKKAPQSWCYVEEHKDWH